MNDNEYLKEKLAEGLLKGERDQCYKIVDDLLNKSDDAISIYIDFIFPILAEIERLSHRDRISMSQRAIAISTCRCALQYLKALIPKDEKGNRSILIVSEDIFGEIYSDIFEVLGWIVNLLGTGIMNDDVLAFINDFRPEVLLISSTSPRHAQDIARLVHTIREINAWPNMKIGIRGGMFGVLEEHFIQQMNVDFYIRHPGQAIDLIDKGKSV